MIAKPKTPPMPPTMISPAIGTQYGKGSGDPSSKCAATAIGMQACPAAQRSCSVRLFNAIKQFNLIKSFTAEDAEDAEEKKNEEKHASVIGRPDAKLTTDAGFLVSNISFPFALPPRPPR